MALRSKRRKEAKEKKQQLLVKEAEPPRNRYRDQLATTMGNSRSKVCVEPANEDPRALRNPFAPVAHIHEGEFFRDGKDTNFELFRNGTDFIFIPHPSPSKDSLVTVKPGPNNSNGSRNIYVASSSQPLPR